MLRLSSSSVTRVAVEDNFLTDLTSRQAFLMEPEDIFLASFFGASYLNEKVGVVGNIQ